MKPRRSFGNRAPTKAQHRAALTTLLTLRADLDGLRVESLVRSYGLPLAEITAAINAERRRRAGRA